MAYGTRVSGLVFLDQDADGTRETADSGLSGVTVRLLNSLGTVVATTTSASDGSYAFTEIAPGTYRVQTVAPTGDVFSPVGTATGTSNSVVSSTGISPSFTLATNGTVANQNAGLYVPVSVHGTAFTDLDNDGVVDNGESVRAGVTVQLQNAAGTVVGTTTTGSDGTYSFTDLAPGTYSVHFVAPSGAVFSPRGSDTAPQPVSGSVTALTNLLTNGSFENTALLGRPGYSGWTVSANTTSTPYGSGPGLGPEQITTDGRTSYATTGLGNNGYGSVVAPDDANANYAGGSGTHAAFFLDDGARESISQTVSLTAGQVYEIGFDLYQSVPGSGNPGDFLLTAAMGSQTVVTAGSSAGTPVAVGDWTHYASTFTATTTGTYTFSLNYQAGSGTAKDVIVDNVYVTAGQTTRDLTTSSQVNSSGTSSSFTLTSGQSIGNESAGIYFPPGSITGNVFTDSNADGIKGSTEAGLASQTVRLLSGLTVVATTTTDASGNYTFSNLTAGTYTVQVVGATGNTFSPTGSSTTLPNSTVGTLGTATVTVANGTTTTVNAGEYTTGSFSGVAFVDTNGDGIQGTGEAGIVGETVQLLNAAGTLVATTLTGVNGAYSFTGVAPGTYQLQFVAPTGTAFTLQDQGTNDAVDSDVSSSGRTASIALTSGQTVANVSAGSYVPASISGATFTDADGDGVRGLAELGTVGVTVQLINAAGTVVATTTTGVAGAYSFTGVAPGTYQVQFVAPTGTVFTAQDQGTNDAVDSDANASGRTASVTVASGGIVTNLSAGTFTPATVSGVAFTDSNGDGIQGTGETGIAGETVQLLNAAGTVVATTTTGTSGAYSFTGVAPGSYQLQFVAPTGTVFTAQDQGLNDAVDSDVNSTGRTGSFVLLSGGSATNLSAGSYAPATVSGLAFTDSNGDGIQGTGETGVAGETVRLLNAAGTVVATTTTGANGAYSFTGVTPGTYQLQFVAPTGTVFTAQDQGSNDAVDSDVSSSGRTASIALTSGQTVANVSAGTYTTGSFSGVAFTDTNGDGIQGTGEAGIVGETVQLLNAAGTVVATTLTGTGGAYSFTGVAPGTYQLQFVAPTGTVFTAQDRGTNDAVDSDVSSSGRTASIALTSGQTVANVSAGSYVPVTIGGSGDLVFNDLDGNGIRDTGEAGVAGATVRLLDADGAVVATTVTGTGGTYSFTGVAPGQYQVQFVAPTGTAFTAQDQGTNDAVDSDANVTTGRSALFTATSGQVVNNIAAGVFTPAATGTGDIVFVDSNGDGIRNASEAGLAGATVQLLNAAGTVVATTTTNADGIYSFTGVTPGTYQVQFTAPTGTVFTAQDRGLDDAIDSDVNPATGRTANITVTSGGTISNVGAGLYTPVSVSGAVFTDADGDGIRGTGEAGIAGQTVQLLNAAGTVVATTTTGTSGAYSFTGVAPGQYQVQFATTGSSVFTAQDQGNNAAVDSDANPLTGRTALITLTSGQGATDISAGTYVPATVGGTAFVDTNGDGIQGTGEAGIVGETVQLLNAAGAVVATTLTGTGGAYSFTGVTPGQYQLQFVAPTGTVFTQQDQGSNDAVDSDVNAAGRTATVTVTSGQTLTGVSAGSYVPAAISGVAFADNNGDGIQGLLDLGVVGETVQLINAAGTVVATTTTGVGGIYSFTGVAPGTYQLQFVAPTGTVFSPQDQGLSDLVDSDVNSAGRTGNVTVASGGVVTNLSAGTYATTSLSGLAFTDTNGDGIRDSNDPGLTGVTVQLLNAAGTVVATTTTGTGGAYSFTGVAPGQYQVQFAAPSGTVFTAQNQGTNDTIDSDVNPATGRSALLTLASGTPVTNISAGTYVPVSVSGVAFTDTNGDGIRGTGEAGTAGVSVQLLNNLGNVVATTTSGADGAYSFTGVVPGTYQVQFAAPTGTVFSAQDQGTNDAVDSDVSSTGRTATFTLASGGSVTNLSAGTFTPATISGGAAFTDSNGNGIRDSGETGVAGETVQLINAAGTVVATTTTGANGAYSFTGVAPGSYQLQFVAPTGTVFSPQDQGTNDAVDSDVNSTGRTASFTVTSGQTVSAISAGTFTPATISGGAAFTDSNGNGIQDSGETGVAGETVQLINAAGTVVATTTTGANGAYSFTGVAPGTYQLQFVAPTGTVFTRQDQGTNDAVDSDVGSNGRTASFTVTSGQTVSGISAGTYTPATIGGSGTLVFTDTDGDGIRETGETGTAGVTVQLVDADGTVVATTTTAANGTYSFTGVAPGEYQLQFVAPAGTIFTAQDQGTNDAVDSDADRSNGRTAIFTVGSGQTVDNLAAGVFAPGSTGSGNVVFVDSNGNGIRDAGEAGAAGATVQLVNNTGTVIATTTTGADGTYSFTGVTPGQYQVQFTAPAGSVFTAPDQGINDAVDSDANPATGRSGTITVPSGGTIANIGAGIYVPVGISGTAFTDSNGDGIQGTGETGVAGETVQLLNAAGTIVATTVTGSTGAYSFTGLTPGQYQLQFVAPTGTVFTAQDQGSNDAVDSDVNAAGRTASITLTSGQTAANVSAGSFTPTTVGGVAFTDTNGDGIQEAGETGAAGVTVHLLDSAGNTVATTTTGASGAYSFASVAPGTYQVEFVAPSGTVFGPQNQGGNDATDSDVDPTTGRTASFAVTSGTPVANLSAALASSATQLGGDVWLDSNGNGIRDTGEQLLAGVAVRLLDANGQDLGRSTVTDANGHYSFLGLQAGDYRVGFAPLIGTAFTQQDQGSNESLDSDATPSNGVSSLLVSLTPGTNDQRSSAGLVLALSQSPTYSTSLNLGDGNNGFPGTANPDVLHGNGGDDALNGLGGNDTFYGDDGNDALNGHDGNDYLDGGAGNDNVQGQDGNDTLLGGDGDDIGEGGNGNDVLMAGAGNDNMQGENGDDSLFGGGGNDILTGNAGNDLVAGGAGNDTLQGADGNDIVIGGSDNGRMTLGSDGHITGVVTGDMLEGNGGADAFVWQPGDGVDLLLDFNPAEGDTLTIYGYSGFSAVERGADGRMELYLGENAGFVLNNGTFQGATVDSTFAGVRFISSTTGAPGDIVSSDTVVPVLVQNWVSNFQGTGAITVSQPFPALDTPADPTNLTGVTFDSSVQLSSTNDTYTLGSGNQVVDGGSGYDVVNVSAGFRGVGHTTLPDGSLRLDIGTQTDVLRNVEDVHFVDGTLHLSVDSTAAQVTRLYDASLGRDPDQGGLNYWIGQLDSGRPLQDLADTFLTSPEFQARYGNPSNQDFVQLLYENVLGREPDAGGAAYFNAALAAGASRSSVLLTFSESAENKAASLAEHPGGIWDLDENAATTARLYDTVLQRLPDVSGLSFWTTQLDAGTQTASGVANAFVSSPEFQATYGTLSNEQLVSAIYLNALDRPVDAAGLQYWTGQLDNGLARSDFVLQISESPEHQTLTQANIMNETPSQFGILFA
ncbi:SdrD B-like domain-containing protein [Roseomonas elaeocarpi]|uniref:SdrD B-like domain-containing protein n=1 Tax=Roseomonas elaeocarpi TaxID=907779 RepID=A0ABV6JLL4_9PROT